jgi:intracellular sulfur oxidation DsrE/DsrF family protein
MPSMSTVARSMLFLLMTSVGLTMAGAAEPELVHPIITDHGGVVPRPTAVQQPRAGAKVVFDVTADAAASDVNKGLDRAARLLNLYGAAELRSSDLQLVIVLHGEATKTVLSDAAYQRRFGPPQNPNLPLLRQLQQHGVEVLVCGQALNYKGFADQEMADRIPVAAAAMTTVINKQMDGWAYLPFP